MFTGFNHVMLWVKDLELAKKFYGEGLGMRYSLNALSLV